MARDSAWINQRANYNIIGQPKMLATMLTEAYRYGNHLTFGLAKSQRFRAAVFTSHLPEFFRLMGLRIPFLRT